MKTVWKYPVAFGQILWLPVGAKVLHVGEQDGAGFLWALVESDAMTEMREFAVIGTGHPVHANAQYVGTYTSGPFVWHVFEVLAGPF